MSKSQRLNKYFTYSIIGTQEAKLLSSYEKTPVQSSVIDPSCWIGIEVEVEGIRPSPSFSSALWEVTSDGSLRNNGMEYISIPLRGKLIPVAVEQLHTYLTKFQSHHEFSSRTSVHIHQNVRYLTVEQIFNLLLCYMVVEPILYEYAQRTTGRNRETNNFCVPINDSKFSINLPQAIEYMHKGEEEYAIRVMCKYWKKYTGLNLIPVQSQGTIEYRHMGGTSNPETLMQWINMLQSLRGYAKNHTHNEVKTLIFSLNTTSSYLPFVEEVLGTSFGLSSFELQHLMEKSVETIKEVYAAIDYKVTFDTSIDDVKKAPLYQVFYKRLGGKYIGVIGAVDDSEYLKLLMARKDLNLKYDQGYLTLDTYTALYKDLSKRLVEYEEANPEQIKPQPKASSRHVFNSPLLDL